MKKIKTCGKRLLVCLMALTVLFAIAPTAAFADGTANTEADRVFLAEEDPEIKSIEIEPQEKPVGSYHIEPNTITITMSDGEVYSGDPYTIMTRIEFLYHIDAEFYVQEEDTVDENDPAFYTPGTQRTYHMVVEFGDSTFTKEYSLTTAEPSESLSPGQVIDFNGEVSYKFVPSADGTYVCKSLNAESSDPYVKVIHAGEIVDTNDSVDPEGGDYNFRAVTKLTAGETYYYHFSDTVSPAGTAVIQFTNADLTDETLTTVTLDEKVEYTGSEITPEVTVKQGDATLIRDTDYTVSYSDNTELGEATVTVTGTGGYTGTITKHFTIYRIYNIRFDNKAEDVRAFVLADAMIDPKASAPITDFLQNIHTVVSGYSLKLIISNEAEKILRFSAVDPDTGNKIMEKVFRTVSLPDLGIDKVESNVDFTLEETKAEITDAVLEYTEVDYTGNEMKPAVTVSSEMEGETDPLTEGKDYTVAYKDNTEPGEAKVIITGQGDYAGTLTRTFTINDILLEKMVLSDTEIPAGASFQLVPEFTPADTTQTKIKWSSSDPGIATVDKNGKVKGVKRGTVTVTAVSEANSKIKATCKVTVLFKDATHENVSDEMFDAIYWAADKKITGMPTVFKTKDNMTRGQFVRFLFRYAGMEGKYKLPSKYKKNSPFKDLSTNHQHYKAIVWAVGKGLIKGYSDGTFHADGNLTRSNVATILWKFAGSKKVKNTKNPFSDVSKSTPIAWGKQQKIFTGTKFEPKKKCTRGDFALFLYRYDKAAGK